MINYAKIFKDKILKDFDKEAKKSIRDIAQMRKAGIQHVPPRYKFSPFLNFSITINDEVKDNLDWIEGQARCYMETIARLCRRSKIKSIYIKSYEPEDNRPDDIPKDLRIVVGHIEFTR